MTSKKISKLVFLTTLASLIFAALLLAQNLYDHPEYQIRLARTMTSTAKPASKLMHEISNTYFARRDGSAGMQTIETYNNRPCTTTTIWNTVTKEQVTTSDCVSLKNTVPLGRVRHLLAPKAVATCLNLIEGFKLKGAEYLQTLKVEKYDSDTQSAKATLYVAPELGCLIVRAQHYWRGADGTITATTFDEPTEIRLGVYDPTLFVIPTTFREARPLKEEMH
jgi:hypothetical protein